MIQLAGHREFAERIKWCHASHDSICGASWISWEAFVQGQIRGIRIRLAPSQRPMMIYYY